MNRVLIVFSDGLLSELDSARGLISRSAWIRQAVEDKLMKEAVAPLVPVELVERDGVSMTIARRGVRPEDIVIPEPKPKARRKKSYEVAPTPEFSITTNSVQTPARCNRGACTGTINPVSGRCLHCNQTPLSRDPKHAFKEDLAQQTPLKESK